MKNIINFFRNIFSGFFQKNNKVEKRSIIIPFGAVEAAPKKEIKWASWIEKSGHYSLPLAKEYVSGIKTNKQIVMQMLVCGPEEKKGQRDLHGEIRLRSIFATYKPALFNPGRYEEYLNLFSEENFFVNFCIAVGGSQAYNGRSAEGSCSYFIGREQVCIAKAINKGHMIIVKDIPVAEIIDNNLFIYVDLFLKSLDHFFIYSSGKNETPMSNILPQIIEEANKYL